MHLISYRIFLLTTTEEILWTIFHGIIFSVSSFVLTRLRAHLDEFVRLCESQAPVGRQLDFLMQEMNREANTLTSKAQSAEVAARVVAMKAELERLREQVQNVE